MTSTESLLELSKLGSREATLELAYIQEQMYNSKPAKTPALYNPFENTSTKKAMYCPEHKITYNRDGNPFSNTVCGICGCQGREVRL